MASLGVRAMFGVGCPAVGGPAGRSGVAGVPVSPAIKSLNKRKFSRAWAILSDNNIPSPITSIEYVQDWRHVKFFCIGLTHVRFANAYPVAGL